MNVLSPPKRPAACLLVFVAFAALTASAQKAHHTKTPAAAAEQGPTQRSAMSPEEYEHLLNVLFPIDRSFPPGLEYTLVLRFEPNLHPESQVTIRHWHDGRIEARYEQVLEGNAWRAASSHRVAGQSLDLQQLAKEIPVRRYGVVTTPAQVNGWHDGLLSTITAEYSRVRRIDKEVRRTGQRTGISNGTRYELWYIQGDDEIHATSWDAEVGPLPTGAWPLALWANGIRFYASNHITALPPGVVSIAPSAQGTEVSGIAPAK